MVSGIGSSSWLCPGQLCQIRPLVSLFGLKLSHIRVFLPRFLSVAGKIVLPIGCSGSEEAAEAVVVPDSVLLSGHLAKTPLLQLAFVEAAQAHVLGPRCHPELYLILVSTNSTKIFSCYAGEFGFSPNCCT